MQNLPWVSLAHAEPPSRVRVPVLGLLGRLLPIGPGEIPKLNGADEGEPKSDTKPQALEFPAEAKGRPEGQRQGNDVVRHKICIAAKLLLASASKQAMRDGSETVEELHHSAHGHHFRNKVDDFAV